MIPDEEKNPDLFKWVRTMGKQIAFGLLYGMGITLLAAEIGRSKEEAKEFMTNFFARFRNAQTFIKKVHRAAVERGFVKNRWGRRRWFPEDEAYKAVNFLIQGTAADLMKDATVRVWRALLGYETNLILTVHDELVFDIPWHEAETVIPIIVEEMERPINLNCDLKCDLEYGPRWSELNKLSCETCDGKGLEVNVDKATLIDALFENNRELLVEVQSKECTQCSGHGYDLKKLKKVA
jgi:DNA polymerase-1